MSYGKDCMDNFSAQQIARMHCNLETHRNTWINYTPNNFKIIVFPNPANESFSISFDNPFHEPFRIHIFNLLGEIMTTQNIKEIKNRNVINCELLGSGIYIIRIDVAGKTSFEKIVVL